MGNTVTLHSACEYGDLAQVHRLLETATAKELEATDDCGRTPLLLAVTSLKHLREQSTYLDDFDDLHGFSDSDEELATITQVKRQNKWQNMDSIRESSYCEAEETVNEVKDDADLEFMPKEAEILHLLLQRRVNVDHKDENGWTALHYACFVQNAVAIRMLIHAGAKPMRESYGLLPQDLLQRGQMSEWVTQAQELKEALDLITDKSAYTIKLLAFRPSGVVQLDMGGQVEKGSFVTLEYAVPDRHSVKDYIQVLISKENSAEIETGSYHYVPANAHGQLTISTKDIPSASTVRFVYVKSDVNKMSREVVASGCNAVVQASVGEIFQYELFLYERVVEVESISEFEFVDQPLIVLKRIGIVVGEDIDWVTIRPDNHIVAVNDIRIDEMEFAEAVHVLQENNGRQCTKLLMQNYSACGDFIPEKILGVNVVDKYASLHPVDEDQDLEGDKQTYEDWVRDNAGIYGGDIGKDGFHDDGALHASSNQLPTDTSPPSSRISILHPVEGCGTVSKVFADDESDDPMSVDREDKLFTPSTIETVVPLHNSRQLVEQLQHGILISHANR